MMPPAAKLAPLVDPQQFRDAMALLAAPITVVTTRDGEGERWGFTASAVSSVSLDPPLVLVGVARTASCHRALTSAGEFVINVLTDRHREVAVRFATHGIDRFADRDFTQFPGTRLPCLPDANLLVHCHTWQVVPAGDHDLLIGAVAEVHPTAAPGKPLLWYQRGFHTAGE